MGTLASGLAHDFNNILLATIGFSAAAENPMRRVDLGERVAMTLGIARAARAALDGKALG